MATRAGDVTGCRGGVPIVQVTDVMSATWQCAHDADNARRISFGEPAAVRGP